MTRMEKATQNETMSDIDVLIRLQELDGAIRLLRRELASLPVRAKEVQDALTPLARTLEASREQGKARLANVKTLDLEIQGHRERIARIREQQLQAKTNKDYQALQDEINKIQAVISGIEDRQLACLEEADQAQAAVAESEAAVARQQEVIAGDLRDLDRRRAELEAEVNRALTERAAMAKGIQNQARLDYYNRVIENKQDAALVPVENGSCGGCHLKLQPQLVHDARRPDLITVCSYCGRMLFVKDEIGRDG